MSHRVEIRPAARRFLKKLRDDDLLRRITAALRELESNPRPVGSEKMAGPDDLHRIRIGDYRVVYQIHDQVLLVLIIRIGNRREVYR